MVQLYLHFCTVGGLSFALRAAGDSESALRLKAESRAQRPEAVLNHAALKTDAPHTDSELHMSYSQYLSKKKWKSSLPGKILRTMLSDHRDAIQTCSHSGPGHQSESKSKQVAEPNTRSNRTEENMKRTSTQGQCLSSIILVVALGRAKPSSALLGPKRGGRPQHLQDLTASSSNGRSTSF